MNEIIVKQNNNSFIPLRNVQQCSVLQCAHRVAIVRIWHGAGRLASGGLPSPPIHSLACAANLKPIIKDQVQ